MLNIDGNKWVLTCCDGKTRAFEQEPKAPREMYYGMLISNFRKGYIENYYDIILPDKFDADANASAGEFFYI